MKKTFLILILSFLINTVFSQETQSVYRFKLKQKKRGYTYYESDSLVLYNNGSFYREDSYAEFDNFGYSELKGEWKIKNKILYLKITKKNENKTDKNWIEFSDKFKYLVKEKKIIPIHDTINDRFDIYATRKLKLIK